MSGLNLVRAANAALRVDIWIPIPGCIFWMAGMWGEPIRFQPSRVISKPGASFFGGGRGGHATIMLHGDLPEDREASHFSRQHLNVITGVLR